MRACGAVSEIRKIGGKQCFVSGMTAFVEDLKELAEKEEPVYVAIAVVLCCIVLAIFMDSWIIPLVFIAGIGMSILYNLGSNVFMGQISYITKALSAVLQLGVTMDYSIFLWHSYEEQRHELGRDKEEAMSHAVANTFVSITGSSLTTVAGFLALCFMTFTLGKDLGIVMAKGVIFGVLGCITILPSLILTFEPLIEKTRHKGIIPKFDKLSGLVTKKPGIFAVIFIVLMIPAYFGYTHTSVYYNLDKSVPETLPFHIANDKLGEEFDMNTTHMLLVNADMDKKDVDSMMQDIDKIDGVKYTLGLESAVGPAVPDEIIPGNLENIVKSENYQLLIINSKYKVASDKVNDQIDSINKVVKKYDNNGMLDRRGTMYKGFDQYHRQGLQGSECDLYCGHIHYHSDSPEVDIFADHTGSCHRAGYLYKHGHSLLYRDGAAVHRLDMYQHDTARRDGGLRDTDDHAVQTRALRRQEQA